MAKKLLIFFLLIFGVKAFGQATNPTPNIGFENGDFSNWVCYTGSIDVNGNITVSPTSPIAGLHTIISKTTPAVTDPYGLFPVLCPNGSNFSIKLNDNSAGKKAQRVTYTFTVPNVTNYSIIFNYAVVLENPPHMPFQQPAFTANVFDVTDGTYINCPSFDFIAGSALPGFTLSNVAAKSSIYYKDWSTATIDLKGYIGKTMRIEFTVNDCTLGGHFGYAYLDVQDNSSSTPISGNNYCVGQNSVTLYAPNGFSGYTWYKSTNLTQPIGTGQSLTLSPPPPDGTQYALQIAPYPGLGCVDTLYTVVNKLDDGFNLMVQDTVYGCPGTGVDLTAASVTEGSSSMTFAYFNDALATSYLYNPNAVTTAGTYYIQGINSYGCQAIKPVTVVLGIPGINVTDPPAVVFPVTVDLTTTYTAQPGLTYTFYTDSAATNTLTNYKALTHGGTYYIKVVNNVGCTVIVPVHVTIYPPPPYVIDAPTAFTPNNDGVNDHWGITIQGYLNFGSIRVYNRNGQLMFTAKSIGEFWDGNYNGQPLPAGTYYWLFNGEDSYYYVPVTKAAWVTLLR